MPAEWEPHRGTWLSWPHKEASWPGKFDPVPGDLRRDRPRIWPTHEEVHINVAGPGHGGRRPRASWPTRAPTPGTCSSTTSPPTTPGAAITAPSSSSVTRTERARTGDRRLGLQRLGRQVSALRPGRRQFPSRIGAGAGPSGLLPRDRHGGRLDRRQRARAPCSPREACLLNPNRNPQLDRATSRPTCATYLGVEKILWLGDGIVGDDTDGHVDDLTRFVNPTTVVTVVEDDPADENYEPLQENLERLREHDRSETESRSASSRCRCRDRSTTRGSGSRRATPTSTSPTASSCFRPTTRARIPSRWRRCERLFPDREVVGIDCTDLVWGLGAFHCVTQQWPEPIKPERKQRERGRRSVTGEVRRFHPASPRSRCPFPAHAVSSPLLSPSSRSPRAPHAGRHSCPCPSPATWSSSSVRLTA